MPDVKPLTVEHPPVTPPPTIWSPMMADLSRCKNNTTLYAADILRPMKDSDLLALLKTNQDLARRAYEEWANQVGLCSVASRKDWQDRAERRGHQIKELTQELEALHSELKDLRAQLAAAPKRRTRK